MKNMSGLIKQAQQMQKKMAEVDKMLSESEVTGSVNGDLITVKMSGKGEMKNIKIDPSLLDDLEMLEDLIVAATLEAKRNADKLSEDQMKLVTGGMPLPSGMKLP